MLADPHYRDIASANRGRFLEQEIARMMRSVFGRDHVFTNVVRKTSKHQIAAEADVLVAYGEFLLVVQAKSKRLTLAAKAGDFSKINDDFQAAIQSAYDQAIKFIDLALTGAECEIGPSSRRVFESLVRAFPIVVLSDHFPSLTFLTNKLVKEDRERSPVVIDLFFLNILLEILNNPVDALYYLQQRARFFSRLLTDSEYNLLGFHVKQKLYVNDEWHMMLIDRDFAQDIDSYFTAKETGQDPTIEFVAMEDRMDIPAASALISSLKCGPPEAAGAAIKLLDFSEHALRGIADNILMVQAEVRAGKVFKAFSVESYFGGISYAAMSKLSGEMVSMAEAVARRHKYRAKKDRWYVVLDCVHSSRTIDGVLPICEKWVESDEMDKFAAEVGDFMNSTLVPFRSADSPPEEGRSNASKQA